jgi:hypothetical protein
MGSSSNVICPDSGRPLHDEQSNSKLREIARRRTYPLGRERGYRHANVVSRIEGVGGKGRNTWRKARKVPRATIATRGLVQLGSGMGNAGTA